MAEYITHSREETVALGRKLAAVLPDGALIAFTGGLGAGKTAFCEGLAHFDLYRISTENDLCAAGFYDYLDQGAIVAAEWSENFADLLAPEDPIYINIDRVDDTTRRITIEGVSV